MNVPKPYQGKDKFIFISYSHRDTAKVFPIITKLMEKGYRVWYDQGIDPGTEWDENIATHIDTCGYFIAFMSNNYLGSNNCKDELNYARDLEKDRLIVYLEEVTLPAGMAMRVNRLQSVFKYAYTNEADFYEKLFAANNIGVCLEEKVEEKENEAVKAAEPVKPEPVQGTQSSTEPTAPSIPSISSIPTVTTASASPKKPNKWLIIGIIVAIVAIIGIIIAIAASGSGNDNNDSYDSTDFTETDPPEISEYITTFQLIDEDGMISEQTFYYGEDDIVFKLVDKATIPLAEGTTEDDIQNIIDTLDLEFAAASTLDYCDVDYSYDENSFTLTITSTELDTIANIGTLAMLGVLETDDTYNYISFEVSKEALLNEGYSIIFEGYN